MPESASAASMRRGDSGSPLQASATPPLVRIDEIRFFSAGRRHQQESLSCGTIDGSSENRFGTAHLPLRAIDAGRARLANDAVDFGSLLLGPPIAHCDQEPNLRRRYSGRDRSKRFRNHAAAALLRL